MAFGDFTVTRASTKNVLGDAGLYVSVANNVPAFEFNTDGTYRGLLVEPGATNILERSQEFDNAYWTKNGTASVTPNTEVSPDGTTTADTLSGATGDTATTSTNTLERIAPVASSQTYTYSIFLKSAGATTCKITARDASTGNTTSLTVSLTSSWQRVSVVRATGVSTTQMNIRVGGSDGDIFIWQAQLETGSVATSPIVTTAGTASRVADAVTLTGASSLIGQSAGTVFLEVILANATTASFGRVLEVGSNTTNRISIDANSSTLLGFIITGGVATQGGTMSEASANNVSYKIALAYAVGASQGAFYVNGTGDITSPTAIPASNDVYIGRSSSAANGVVAWYRSVALFPTRLANATLASLTA